MLEDVVGGVAYCFEIFDVLIWDLYVESFLGCNNNFNR